MRGKRMDSEQIERRLIAIETAVSRILPTDTHLDLDWLTEPDITDEVDDMPTSLAHMVDDLADVPFPDDEPYTADDLDRDDRLAARW